MPEESGGKDIQDKPPSQIRGVPSTPAYPNPTPDKNGTEQLEAEIKRGEWWLIRIGIATLLINTIIAVIYWGQLKEMREATRLTSEAVKIAGNTLTTTQQANAQQRADSAAAAVEAKALADQNTSQSAASLQATIDNFHRDQRAWLGIVTVDLKETLPYQANFTYVNSGKTPAINVRMFHELRLIQDNQADFRGDRSDRVFEKPYAAGIAAPGIVLQAVAGNPKNDPYFAYRRIYSGHFYLHGRIAYDDVFGKHHWMVFCYIFAFRTADATQAIPLACSDTERTRNYIDEK